MATTSIWAVKDNLKRVIDYVSNPQKTENKDFDQYDFKGLENVIEYTTNDLKTEKQFYVSGINCHPSNALQQMVQTKKSAHKEDGVLAFHGYQSFQYGEVTPTTAHQIGVELAQQMWGDDFEVIVSTHLDKGHFHNHFVVNSVSWTTRKRFLNKHRDYDRLRRLSDELCRKYKLSVIENPKKGKHYAEWNAEKQKIPTKRSIIKDDVDRAILHSRTFTQFVRYLKDYGYDVKTNVKHIAVKPPGSDKFFRLHNLTNDEYYSEENIKSRILENCIFVKEKTNLKSSGTKYRYHGQFKKAKKLTGIKALYFHYLYRMGIIPQSTPHQKRVYFFMKEDLRYMDKITKETTLICKKKINTIEDLDHYENSINQKLDNLIKERRCFYNKVRRCKNSDTKKKLQADIGTLSAEIKELRKEVVLCSDIRKRSLLIAEKLKKVNEMEKGKDGEKENERRRRNSRSGRTHDTSGY